MSENNKANKKRKKLYDLLNELKQQVDTLKEQYGDETKLSPIERERYKSEKDSLIQKIDLLEKCIKIAIIKKVDSMRIEELQNIALQSLSIISEGINPDEFISEYERLNQEIKEYQDDLQRRRSILEDLIFIARGPLDVLVDKNGNPRSGFIILEEDAKLVKKHIENNRNIGNIRIKVKVPRDYFSDEDLNSIMFRNDRQICWIVKKPDDYVFKNDEPSLENPLQYFEITGTAETGRKLLLSHKISDVRKTQHAISRMQIILPEIKLKKRLMQADINYLRKYVKELLVDPHFINHYMYSISNKIDDYEELQHLYWHEITNLSDQDFDSLMEKIESISVESLQKLFDSPEKIDRYIYLISEMKSKTTSEIPGIWLKPVNPTDETNEIINSASNIFRVKSLVGCLVYPEFITEEDLQLLEQNKTIIKNVNGVNIPFNLALNRYKGIGFCLDKTSQQRPKITEKLYSVVREYRRAIKADYPKQLEKIAECNRKLEALERLKSEYSQPGMQEPTSPAKPRR